MESVSPNIFTRDIKASMAFYKMLGFDVVTTVPDAAGEPLFAMMANGSVTFMFQTFESLGTEHPLISRADGASLLLYIKVKSIRAFHEQIKNNVTILSDLEKTFYGATEFSIRDNNNYMLTFAEDE
jgi:uncharacterized glyoxalase superfamily protein PhnB